MLRLFRPDLLCALGGFTLGAAALLIMHLPASSPQSPTLADKLEIAAAPTSPSTRPAG